MAQSKSASKQATPSKAKSHKRGLSTSGTSAASTPATRSSKRIKASEATSPANKSTPTKSKYFENPDSEDEEDADLVEEETSSGYEDEDGDASSTEPSAEPSESEEYNSDEEEDETDKRKRKRQLMKKKAAKSPPNTVENKDLWREGVKTGLGPGKQVFIPKPKARGDGGIKYMPGKIHPNTMEFLKDLKKNNDRQWLKAHDPDYRQSWKDFESFVETLTEKIAEIDATIPELPPKDIVFRIYRDIRFSSDPTPYKPHFSGAWSRTGRKGPYACYYVHIQPGNKNFVGSGLWHPESGPIALMRADIDQHPERLLEVLTQPDIRKHIFGGIPKDQKKAIKAFTTQNAENALKVRPKGFDADHPNIELLRLRNYTLGQKISDAELLGSKGLDRVLELVKALYPFVTYLNGVVMPDDPDDDEVADQPTSNSSNHGSDSDAD